MIVDDLATKVGPDKTLEPQPDVCIVGSGAAGISMALTLIDAKKPSGQPLTVAVLESSRFEDKGTKHRYQDDDVQKIYLGEMVRSEATDWHQASAEEFFLGSRVRGYGGTTNCWTGWTQPLSDLDLVRTEVNPAYLWPFGPNERQQLYDGYKTAMEYCSIGMFDVGRYDLRVGDNLKYWKEQAEKYGISGRTDIDILTLGAALYSRVVIRMGGLDYRPPAVQIPDGAWDFQKVWNNKIAAAKNVTLYRNANVREILTDGGHVARLKVSTLKGDHRKAVKGQDCFVQAGRYVLATGCVENTRLLLHRTGFDKTHPALGCYLMTHPLINQAATFTTNDALPESVRRLYGFDLLLRFVSDTPPVVFAVAVPNDAVIGLKKSGNFRAWIGFGHREFAPIDSKGPANQGTVDFNCEQWPDVSNKIDMSSKVRDPVFDDPVARVKIELKPADYTTITFGLETLRDALYGQGHAMAGTFKSFTDDPDYKKHIIVTGEHAMGTTRIGTSTSDSVVNGDCRMLGVDNLYVAGGSVFRTGGWANPTLTIIALAVRLARHLKAKID